MTLVAPGFMALGKAGEKENTLSPSAEGRGEDHTPSLQ
jgi:hypothetical protein